MDEEITTTTALEIHQIEHNVIRTNPYRQIVAPEIRRNSITSSVSGTSTMLITCSAKDNASNTFVHPRNIQVRPIQVKTEPLDPDDELPNDSIPVTSSPSNASEPVVAVSSNASKTKRSFPMVQINGLISNDSFGDRQKSDALKSKFPAPLSVKLSRKEEDDSKPKAKLDTHKLRTIRKSSELRKSKRKIQMAIKEMSQRALPQKQEEKIPAQIRISSKKQERSDPPKKRGRPPKDPNAHKSTHKNKIKAKASKS